MPWGEKALGTYPGGVPAGWRGADATALIEDAADAGALPPILVHQGEGDQILEEQLRPELLREAAEGAGARLDLRMVPGDHSYYTIGTHMAEHVSRHADRLRA